MKKIKYPKIELDTGKTLYPTIAWATLEQDDPDFEFLGKFSLSNANKELFRMILYDLADYVVRNVEEPSSIVSIKFYEKNL